MRNSKLIALLSAGALVVSSMSGLMIKGGDALAKATALVNVAPIAVSDDVIVVRSTGTHWDDVDATYVDKANSAGGTSIAGNTMQRIDTLTAWVYADPANAWEDRTAAALDSDTFVIGAGHDSELVFQIKDVGNIIQAAEDIQLHVDGMVNPNWEDVFKIGTGSNADIGRGSSAKAIIGMPGDDDETWEVHVLVDGSKTVEALEEPGYFWFTSRRVVGDNEPNNTNYFRFQISNYAHDKFVNNARLIVAGGHTADDILTFDRLAYGWDAENAFVDPDRYEVAFTYEKGDRKVVYRRHEDPNDLYTKNAPNLDMVVAFLTDDMENPVRVVNGNAFCGVTALTENRDVNIGYDYNGGEADYATAKANDNPTKVVTGLVLENQGTDSIETAEWTSPSWFSTEAEYKATEIIQLNKGVEVDDNVISIIANGEVSALMVRKDGNVSISSSGINETDPTQNIETIGYEQLGDTKPETMALNAVMRTGSKYLTGKEIKWATNDPHCDVLAIGDGYASTATSKDGEDVTVRAVGNGQAILYVCSADDWGYKAATGTEVQKVMAANKLCQVVFTCTENKNNDIRIWKYENDTTRGAEITGSPKSIDVYTQGPTNSFKVIVTAQNTECLTMGTGAASTSNINIAVAGFTGDIADVKFEKALNLTDDVDNTGKGVPAALFTITGKKVGETTATFTGTFKEVNRADLPQYTNSRTGDLLISVKDVYENDKNIKVDTVFQVGDATYKVLADGTVELVKYNGTDTVVTIDTVDYNGKTYTVSKVGKKAFAAKTLLASVTFGAGVTAIDNGAFKKCSNLKNVTFNGVLTSAGKNVFLKAGKKGGKKLKVTLAAGTADDVAKALKKSNKNAKIK